MFLRVSVAKSGKVFLFFSKIFGRSSCSWSKEKIHEFSRHDVDANGDGYKTTSSVILFNKSKHINEANFCFGHNFDAAKILSISIFNRKKNHYSASRELKHCTVVGGGDKTH